MSLVEVPGVDGPVENMCAQPGVQLDQGTHPVGPANTCLAESEYHALEEIQAALLQNRRRDAIRPGGPQYAESAVAGIPVVVAQYPGPGPVSGGSGHRAPPFGTCPGSRPA